MTKLINKFTHTEMWVADNRKDEYLAAGHTLPPTTGKPTVKSEPEAEPEEVKKATKAPAKKKK